MGWSRRWILAGVAFCGLIAGHAVAYLLLAGSHRHLLLAESGHGYLTTAAWGACVLGLVSLAVSVMDGYGRGGHALGAWPTFARLAIVQTTGFVALELLERLWAGASMETVGPLVAVGVLVQAATALLGTVVVLGARRLGSVMAGRERARRRPVEHRWVPPAESWRPSERLRGLEPVRAPPSTTAA